MTLSESIKRIIIRPEFLLGMLLLIFSYIFIWQHDNWKDKVLSSDGRGYYMYLPALIIHQDVTYEDCAISLEKELGHPSSNHCVLHDEEGNSYNKTFPGVALLQLPLFLLAYFISFLFENEVHGYNWPFLVGIQITAILCCLIGFWALKKTLILKGIRPRNAIAIVAITIFATNVYYYATKQPSMSHIYSFSMIALFCYFVQSAANFKSTKYYTIALTVLAIIILIRPTNGIVIVLIPFILGGIQKTFTHLKRLFSNRLSIAMTIVLPILIISILPLLWFFQTGSWLVWSYSGEGFYFSNPLPHLVLFSFRNGMYVYAPFAIFGLLGLALSLRKDFSATIWALMFFSLNIYIISSWWTYYYGGGFGHRALSEHHVFTILMIGELFRRVPKMWKNKVLSFGLIGGLLSVIQGYQLYKGILRPDFMNFEMYQHVFLKTDDKWIEECHPTLDIHQYGALIHTDWPKPGGYEKDKTFHLNHEKEFGPETRYFLPKIDQKTQLFLEFDIDKKRNNDDFFDEVFMVAEGLDSSDNSIFYQAVDLYQIRTEGLQEFKNVKITIHLEKEGIEFYKFFIWNKNGLDFDIKNQEVKIRHYKP